MADNNQLADGNNDGGDNDIFVYTGGRAPRDVRRTRICDSIDTIAEYAFADCGRQLIEMKGHDKLKKIEQSALIFCNRLRRITKMNGLIEIAHHAFNGCSALSDLDFDKLEIIGHAAFYNCKSLRSINLPSVRRVGEYVFQECEQLSEVFFGEDLEGIEGFAFIDSALTRIAIPLKDDLIVSNDAFNRCDNLSRVDIVGGIHKTISSLHLESWRDEMREEIDGINQTLLETARNKTPAIQRWIRSVLEKMEYYKVEHKVLVKEAMALLELALWKAKLLNEEGMKCKLEEEGKKNKKAKIDVNSAREEHRVLCGANIVIKNVLPFLALE